MSPTLAEALAEVDLEAGRVYHCQVKGRRVVVRVLGPAEAPTPSSYDESDVMLDPWVEFPPPKPVVTVIARPGTLALPDVPYIPRDGSE